ncbi:integrase, catalytic region, zinc finger, CCHC-type containing protein [Tanacetum coccineum]
MEKLKRLSATSRVRRPSNMNLSFKNSVISNTKNSSKKVEVSDRTNKKPDVESKNVALNTTVQSKSLDTTPVVSKAKIVMDTPLSAKNKVVQIVLWIVDSGCSKHITGDRSLLINFVEKFIGTVCFRNDHFATITGYGDYVQGNITICHVYYVEGLGHNLFRDHESNLYTIFIPDMAASSPVSLMSKASSTKSWLWHRRLSHLNFVTMSRLSSSPVASKFAHAPSYYPYIIYSSKEEPFDDLKSEYEDAMGQPARPTRPRLDMPRNYGLGMNSQELERM